MVGDLIEHNVSALLSAFIKAFVIVSRQELLTPHSGVWPTVLDEKEYSEGGGSVQEIFYRLEAKTPGALFFLPGR